MLVVVAMLAVFAWVGVPSVIHARQLANEAEAVAGLRQIAVVQRTLEQPASLGELLASDFALQGWEIEGKGHAVRAGYRIAVHLKETGDDWTAFAWPTAAGATGERAFAIDSSGRVFATSNRPAAPKSELGSNPEAQDLGPEGNTGTDQ